MPNRQSSPCSLDPPIALSYSKSYEDDLPTIIDTFAPRRASIDLSPSSSVSSDFGHSPQPHHLFDDFATTRSRVVRFFNLPPSSASFLSDLFLTTRQNLPTPVTMWVLREDYSGPRPSRDSVWIVFKSHEEASSVLSLSGSALSVVPALENELEPFYKLRRFGFTSDPVPYSPSPQLLRMSPSVSNIQAESTRLRLDSTTDYTLSTNPPNPRSSFRLGDWICGAPSCAAHNFGRNLTCIGCGCPRTTNAPTSPSFQKSTSPASPMASPRFVSPPNYPTSFSPVSPQSYHCPPSTSTFQTPTVPHAALNPPKAPPPAHPLLTPSGRAFASGGKVQNVSSDPLSPCVMYWPDNEPLPEQGQIRPSGLAGVPQPPILNTGNRGPIEHQPGDWICLRCNYLNWRRRKVCQTCFPYAEGNGDSISAAVQSERIALLTSVLAQAQTMPSRSSHTTPLYSQGHRSHSLTPPQSQRSFVDISPPKPYPSVHRSQSHFDLGTRYMTSRPIYQTSGHRQPSPPTSTGDAVPIHAPAPLLPSFLQDIVQSPTLSPASTSSADLSFEEYDDSIHSPVQCSSGRIPHVTDSSSHLPLGNIWRLDGEETKSLSAFALPNHQELVGGSRKNSREMLRPPIT